MSLQSRIAELAQAVGEDMKSVQTSVATLSGQVQALSENDPENVYQKVYVSPTAPPTPFLNQIWIDTSQ